MNWTQEEYEAYLKKQGKPQLGVLLMPVEKKTKYHNNRVKIDGFCFDSQLEADYYSDLKLQLKVGAIKGFCRQPRFALSENLEYVADFIVFNLDGTAEIIDTKGFVTDVYKIKKKVFNEKYPELDIKEVRA